MKKQLLDVIVIGSGGLAREFTSYFSSQVNVIGYCTNSVASASELGLQGEIFGPNIAFNSSPTDNLVLAIASPEKKKLIYSEFTSKGFVFPSIRHSSSIISSSAVLDQGVVVSPMTIVGPNVSIGSCCYLNSQVGVGHDCTIGSFTQINPGVQVGGGSVVLGESILGSNSTLLQNTFLEKKIQIGAGAIVLGKKLRVGTITPSFSKYLPF